MVTTEMNAPATEPLVHIMRDGAVLRLTLNRPKARNALSQGLMAALQSALDEGASDTAVRVIVLAANGPVFSSGHECSPRSPDQAPSPSRS